MYIHPAPSSVAQCSRDAFKISHESAKENILGASISLLALIPGMSKPQPVNDVQEVWQQSFLIAYKDKIPRNEIIKTI